MLGQTVSPPSSSNSLTKALVSIPQNVTSFGKRIFKEIVKSEGGGQGMD